MKLIVLSDTHIPERKNSLQDTLWNEIDNSDGVIHCGDFTSIDFYELIKKRAKSFYAVKGNMDDYFIKSKLPDKLIFNIENLSIGLMHGYGPPHGLENLVYKSFQNDKVDIIIFGHSHQHLQVHKENILLLNPGSPTDYIFATAQTYAILSLEGKEYHSEIKFIG